ncbi:DNA-binding beta-propeller fold protein YncE [Malonomonas rubra DSM 5091]|uniref:DNA-binding beta-propeller fold protein YncE n=1 Tax=Malonomonas rubra DSM 5091 TaxID=1122189 RepID=A0A1M6DVI2_MALRU|nr:hypothetical protein [Malonomonas rubra]SHI77130.1 DNA-binding beta-propeller fold protein YncE [Malonomonas rubra DSM 5091]
MRFTFAFFVIIVLLLAGCAPKATKQHDPVFFPPAPNPPRVQFLMGIGDSRDVEGSETEYSLISMDPSKGDDVKFFIKPYGIASHGEKIYVSDTLAGKVAVINVKQKTFQWLKGGFGPGKLKKPINMTTDNQGNLYVADTIRKKIVMFDPDGNFLRVYGEAYDLKPVDVAVDDRHVYALDLSRSKILVFKRESGELVEGLGQDSDNPKENLSLPTNMTLNERGQFYVTNITTGVIVQLDRDGHAIGTIGKMGDGFGQFGRPKGIASDSDGRIYAVDSAHQNVQLFDKDGRLLMFFGDPGFPVGSLNLPAGIVVSDDDLATFQQMAAPDFELEQVVMVVSQVGRHRVNIYGLGKKRSFDYEGYYKESQEMLKKADESRAQRKKENQ